MATIRASPVLASHAERVSKNIGIEKLDMVFICVDRAERAINIASIIPSRHKRADRKCVR